MYPEKIFQFFLKYLILKHIEGGYADWKNLGLRMHVKVKKDQ